MEEGGFYAVSAYGANRWRNAHGVHNQNGSASVSSWVMLLKFYLFVASNFPIHFMIIVATSTRIVFTGTQNTRGLNTLSINQCGAMWTGYLRQESSTTTPSIRMRTSIVISTNHTPCSRSSYKHNCMKVGALQCRRSCDRIQPTSHVMFKLCDANCESGALTS